MNLKNALYRALRVCSNGMVRVVPGSMLDPLADHHLRSRIRLNERKRQLDARSSRTDLSGIRSHDGSSLKPSVLERDEPWDSLSPPQCPVPGMLTDAEKKYYLYITQFFSGQGAIVEVGTWMGMSTFYLCQGLKQNPRFSGPLHCFDDYVWRETSMGKWVEGLDDFEKPEHLGSFHGHFENYLRMAGHDDIVRSQRVKVADYYGNESLPQLSWDDGPIEIAVIDCGRELGVNQGWYKVLSPSFVDGRTLVIMQDWQNYKRVPEVYWENTKIFTDGLADHLELIHEVNAAGIATFLYHA